MIDAQFVRSIADLAQAANNVSLHTHSSMPSKIGVRTAAGIEWKDVPPPARWHTIHSFADFVQAVKDSKLAAEPEVFHTHGSVVAILNRNERREMISMPLVRTARFTELVALNENVDFDPAEAVKFIRFKLHGVGADTLCAAIRKLDFSRKSSGERTVEHGRESLGKSVEAEVQQRQSVPEEFVADVPIWAVSGLKGIKAKVRVGVYLDVNDESIQLIPLADEIPAALEAAQSELHTRLGTELSTIPVFQGNVDLRG